MNTIQDGRLELDRCPHCGVAYPDLRKYDVLRTTNHKQNFERLWGVYICSSCGGVTTVWSINDSAPVVGTFPSFSGVSEDLPEKAREYLQQAKGSVHAPAGAVMLAASSVDAMLKEKCYRDGSLNKRIDQAVEDNLITEDMGRWAHEVRLDANDQRHADSKSDLPSQDDAEKVVSFAETLGELMFVLPKRVERALSDKED